MCERFGCLPSQLLAEDAGLLRLLRLEEMAGPDPAELGEEAWA